MAIAEQGSKNTSRQRRAVAPLRVFVVENHVDTREFLRFMLEELGHTVLVADTMAKALRDVPAANCDVLISDIGLPDGDGWELLGRLDLPRPIYAIAMSGFGMSSDRVRSKRAGFRHHLVKPMELEQLESILSSAAEELHRSDQAEVRDRGRLAVGAKAG